MQVWHIECSEEGQLCSAASYETPTLTSASKQVCIQANVLCPLWSANRPVLLDSAVIHSHGSCVLVNKRMDSTVYSYCLAHCMV